MTGPRNVYVSNDIMFQEEICDKGHFENKLILPHQPSNDDFLDTMSAIVRWSRWVGVAGSRKVIWKVWGGFLLLLLLAIEGLAVWKVVKALAGWASDTAGHRSVTARLAGAIFYANSLISLVQCWRLSSSWSRVSEYWSSVERALAIKYVPRDGTLKMRMIFVTFLLFGFGTLEHIMSMISTIGLDCPPSLILKKYILKSHGFMILNPDYTIWHAIILLFMSKMATILWNLQDLFIILISMGLKSRYYRLNIGVSTLSQKNFDEDSSSKNAEVLKIYTWRKLREAYVKQALLVRKVDESLGGIMLLSNFANFYFICLQLFLGITQGISNSILQRMYYLVSLSWLCIRTACVVLSSADVHEYSKRALPCLYTCTAHFYNIEIERLQNQLSKDYVALSGLGFFYLTRTILLQMAGAIVTYELVLIQFDTSDHSVVNSTNF